MAISQVGAAAASATSVTLPTHQAGDLIVVIGFNWGGSATPGQPGGWTSANSAIGPGGFTTRWMTRIAYKIAASSSEVSGTWTDTDHLVCSVYRGAGSVGASTVDAGTSSSINYRNLTLQITDGSSWVAGAAAHLTATNVETAPTGMTNRTSTGGSPEAALHDSNGGKTSWSAQAATVNASAEWLAWVFEIKKPVFAASGALVGPGSTVAGSAQRKAKHTVTGAVVGPGSTIVGSAAHKAKHSASGALTGPGSTVSGAATRVPVQFYRASATASANSVTLPSHQAGDYILICAYRSANATAPSLPAGYTNIQQGGANTNSMRVGYKVAASGSETSGTWTNADRIIAVVLRGCRGIGASTLNGGTGTSVNFPALTLNDTSGKSQVFGFAGHRSASNMETAPTGMTNRASVGSGPEAGAHDTAQGVTSWSSQSITANANSGWRTVVVEVLGPVTHAASGALTGAGSTVSGSAAHKAKHGVTGALTGQGSNLSGAAQHKAKHSASGVLSGQGSALAGVAARRTVHAASGAVVGPGSAVAGVAAHKVKHVVSGALAGQGAAIAGAAVHRAKHTASGVLAGVSSTVSGAAHRTRVHGVAGVLVGPGSNLSGAASRHIKHIVAGSLVGPGSTIVGAAKIGAIHVATGALVGRGARLDGIARQPAVHVVGGALVAGGSAVTFPFSGTLTF